MGVAEAQPASTTRVPVSVASETERLIDLPVLVMSCS
jgi:hypothetical protein